MSSVKLPDGSVREFDGSVSVKDVAKSIGSRLAKDAMWGEINLQPVKLDHVIEGNQPVDLKIITKKDPAALATMRHSCAHVMARAVMRLKPNVQLAFGPTIEGGFYYDIESPEDPIREEDFPAIEAEMQKIIELDEPFERIERPRDESIQICQDLHQPLKVEHIQEGLADQSSLSFYQQGEFIDLCRGPHVPSPKAIGAFKLLSIAGATGKGTSPANSCNACTPPPSSISSHWMSIWSESKKPRNVTIGSLTSDWLSITSMRTWGRA